MVRLPESSCTLLHRLRELQAPGCFVRLVFRVLCLQVPHEPRLEHVEYFAGKARLTAAYRRSGHYACGFEYNNDEARAPGQQLMCMFEALR